MAAAATATPAAPPTAALQEGHDIRMRRELEGAWPDSAQGATCLQQYRHIAWHHLMARLPLPRAESCKPLQIASAGFAGGGELVTTLVYRSPASSGADDNADEVGMFHLHHEEEHLRLCRGPRQLQRLRVQRHHLRQQAAGERAAARADAPADQQHSLQNVHTHVGYWSALGPHFRCQSTLAAGQSPLEWQCFPNSAQRKAHMFLASEAEYCTCSGACNCTM